MTVFSERMVAEIVQTFWRRRRGPRSGDRGLGGSAHGGTVHIEGNGDNESDGNGSAMGASFVVVLPAADPGDSTAEIS
jgi:hypothetical protein